MALDLGNFDSVKTFAETYNSKYPHTDVLINNAGLVMQEYVPGRNGLEVMFEINYLGHYLLTRLLENSLRNAPKENGPARIINVSSSAHSFCPFSKELLTFDESRRGEELGIKESLTLYGFTKLCNIYHTESLAQKLGGEVWAFSTHPGWVSTEISRQAGSVWQAFESIAAKTPMEGAVPEVWLACEPLTNKKIKNGGYYDGIEEFGDLSDTNFTDRAEFLWKWSEEFVAGWL
eukprot:TRINITY_DN11308_c0_g1_i3.p1 TRINITY_DN11308_c0_g1~~TRINITY_DN11308_c0_g1_i3.p1  ORF type:complete len:233 (+),score=34.17 TRINITY_DN11308_c0_g1_i3:99-797(+)